jgi:hypothetical protein
VATSLTRRGLEVPNNLLDNYYALGTGFNWNDKLSVELRYMFNPDLLMQYEFCTAEYSSFSVILGYIILGPWAFARDIYILTVSGAGLG